MDSNNSRNSFEIIVHLSYHSNNNTQHRTNSIKIINLVWQFDNSHHVHKVLCGYKFSNFFSIFSTLPNMYILDLKSKYNCKKEFSKICNLFNLLLKQNVISHIFRSNFIRILHRLVLYTAVEYIVLS